MTDFNVIRLSQKKNNKTYRLVFYDYFPWLGMLAGHSLKKCFAQNSLNFANHLNYRQISLIMTEIFRQSGDNFY